jgi:predicted nucleotidyltransferase component of viral defense system
MTDLAEIALTHNEFLRRIPATHRSRGADARFQADYALTRLVAANCAAIGEHSEAGHWTDLVVKGGFAIRHLYGGPRFSKDADLSMVSDELELEGPRLVNLPSDMRIGQETVSGGIASWRLMVDYRRTDRLMARTQIDLNDRSRAIKRRPPQQRHLTSLFLDPFPVWAATLEEIVGEKLFALMDQPDIRIKDVFDLRHVLLLAAEPLEATATRDVYESWRSTKRRGPTQKALPSAIEALKKNPRAREAWRTDVADFVAAAPPLEQAIDELIELLRDRVLA